MTADHDAIRARADAATPAGIKAAIEAGYRALVEADGDVRPGSWDDGHCRESAEIAVTAAAPIIAADRDALAAEVARLTEEADERQTVIKKLAGEVEKLKAEREEMVHEIRCVYAQRDNAYDDNEKAFDALARVADLEAQLAAREPGPCSAHTIGAGCAMCAEAAS